MSENPTDYIIEYFKERWKKSSLTFRSTDIGNFPSDIISKFDVSGNTVINIPTDFVDTQLKPLWFFHPGDDSAGLVNYNFESEQEYGRISFDIKIDNLDGENIIFSITDINYAGGQAFSGWTYLFGNVSSEGTEKGIWKLIYTGGEEHYEFIKALDTETWYHIDIDFHFENETADLFIDDVNEDLTYIVYPEDLSKIDQIIFGSLFLDGIFVPVEHNCYINNINFSWDDFSEFLPPIFDFENDSIRNYYNGIQFQEISDRIDEYDLNRKIQGNESMDMYEIVIVGENRQQAYLYAKEMRDIMRLKIYGDIFSWLDWQKGMYNGVKERKKYIFTLEAYRSGIPY